MVGNVEIKRGITGAGFRVLGVVETRVTEW